MMDGLEAMNTKASTHCTGLPAPVQKKDSCMPHTAALEGGFLPDMDEEEQKLFTPSELLLYMHAVEYRTRHYAPLAEPAIS
jgi:hypothetical protein